MAGPGNIIIRVGAETSAAIAGLNNVNKSLGDTMTKGQKATAALGKAALPAAAALTAIGAGAKVAINAATDLNEQMSKTSVVFGASGSDIIAWSATLAKSLGISQESALEATGTFGNMLVPMGFARDDAAKMSQTMVELAADMASFNNASPEDTLEALRAGLAGESEPLRKFGVFINDARLKQEALSKGLYKGKGALDAHAKAAATMSLILKDTADAQGDFTRTSNSAANQARIQQAVTENLTAELGQALLPAYTAIQKMLITLLGVMGQNTDALQIMVGVVAVLAAGILIANAAVKAYNIALQVIPLILKAATAAQWLFNVALNANPIGLVIIALAALGVALVVAYKKSETFRNIVSMGLNAVKTAVQSLDNAFDALKQAAFQAFDWMRDHWKIGLFAFGPIGAAVYVIATNFDTVKAAGRQAANAVDGAWQVGKFAFSAVAGAVGSIANAFHAVASACWSAISAVQSLMSWLSRIHVPKIDLPGPLMAPIPALAGTSRVGRTAGPVATNGAGGGGITINVYGAVDPEGTARSIRRILTSHDRRQGRVV